MATPTTTEERALALLGAGIGAEAVASAIGVSPSRISQLLSESEFSARVSELRFQNLQKHNELDNEYDRLERKSLEMLEKTMPFLAMDPMKLLKATAVLNAAKRRGQASPDALQNSRTVVNITLPTVIKQQFVTNVNNQVIRAGSSELLTVQSSEMNNMLDRKRTAQLASRDTLVIENSAIGERNDES